MVPIDKANPDTSLAEALLLGCVSGSSATRQWPEVYDLCHTFLHVARVRKHWHTDLRELHAFRVFRVQFSHIRVFSESFCQVKGFSERAGAGTAGCPCAPTLIQVGEVPEAWRTPATFVPMPHARKEVGKSGETKRRKSKERAAEGGGEKRWRKEAAKTGGENRRRKEAAKRGDEKRRRKEAAK